MAVHTGSADERDGDYFGPAVNRVARLMSAGNGGQVLVSTATAQLAQDNLPTTSTLNDRGEHRFKDLSRPEQVFQLLHDSIPKDDRPLHSLDALDGYRIANIKEVSESIRAQLGEPAFDEEFRRGTEMDERDSYQELLAALKESLED